MPLILHTPELRARLDLIHEYLSDFKQNGNRNALGTAVAAMLGDADFAASLKKDPALKRQLASDGDFLHFAWKYVYFYLSRRDYAAAAYILWGKETFSPDPHFSQLTWGALFTKNLINVMGGASTSKTFSACAWVLLDWLLDPEWTRV